MSVRVENVFEINISLWSFHKKKKLKHQNINVSYDICVKLSKIVNTSIKVDYLKT